MIMVQLKDAVVFLISLSSDLSCSGELISLNATTGSTCEGAEKIFKEATHGDSLFNLTEN